MLNRAKNIELNPQFCNVNTELSIAGSTFCSAGLMTINKGLDRLFLRYLKRSFTHSNVVLNLKHTSRAV